MFKKLRAALTRLIHRHRQEVAGPVVEHPNFNATEEMARIADEQAFIKQQTEAVSARRRAADETEWLLRSCREQALAAMQAEEDTRAFAAIQAEGDAHVLDEPPPENEPTGFEFLDAGHAGVPSPMLMVPANHEQVYHHGCNVADGVMLVGDWQFGLLFQDLHIEAMASDRRERIECTMRFRRLLGPEPVVKAFLERWTDVTKAAGNRLYLQHKDPVWLLPVASSLATSIGLAVASNGMAILENVEARGYLERGDFRAAFCPTLGDGSGSGSGSGEGSPSVIASSGKTTRTLF